MKLRFTCHCGCSQILAREVQEGESLMVVCHNCESSLLVTAPKLESEIPLDEKHVYHTSILKNKVSIRFLVTCAFCQGKVKISKIVSVSTLITQSCEHCNNMLAIRIAQEDIDLAKRLLDSKMMK